MFPPPFCFSFSSLFFWLRYRRFGLEFITSAVQYIHSTIRFHKKDLSLSSDILAWTPRSDEDHGGKEVERERERDMSTKLSIEPHARAQGSINCLSLGFPRYTT